MAFDERSIGQLYDARRRASSLLVVEADLQRRLSFDEALILQAASHISLHSITFTETQVVGVTELTRSVVYHGLTKFVDMNVIRVNERQGGKGRRGKPLKLFGPTELGTRVFSFFQDTQEQE
jgi:hypothetical protein